MLNNAWISVSPVELLVQRSCDPSLPEPPYAVHLELAEHINNKKANTPREAAMAAVRLVNHRNPHISVLALALIGTLVEQCGYPFHLQIATKEFLNELVRRFPERPPPFPGPVMQRILDLIHNWREGLCSESRWKEDLGNIRDMHRLLSFKGYRFRDVRRGEETAAAASANLKSPDELEAEDREAHAAKLQELIRRGTPRDLAAAQELMKIMAGANPEQKPDYRSQTMAELNKLEQKVILLNEMLDNVDVQRGERFTTGDVYDQVASVVKEARPKIQKWISDAESDDPESLDTFLQMNDKINNALNRYELYKKGDYAAAANPIPSELSQQPAAKTDLIDFDFDSAPSNTSTGGGASTSSGPDDLVSLFASGPATSAPANGGGQFMGGQMPFGGFAQPQQQQQFPGQMMQQGYGVQMQHPTPAQFGGMTPYQQQLPQQQQHPGYFAQAGQGGQQTPPRPMQFGAIMLPGTPKPASPPTGSAPSPAGSGGGAIQLGSGSAPMAAAPAQQQQAQQGKDPFADLAGLF